MADDPLALWGLDDAARAVYETALAHPDRTVTELAVAVDRPADQVRRALSELGSRGLLQARDDRRVRAGRPSLIAARLATEKLRAAAGDAARATELIAAMDRFADLDPALGARAARLCDVSGLAENWRRIAASATGRTPVECLSVIPDPEVFEGVPAHYPEMLAELIGRGSLSFRCVVGPAGAHGLASSKYGPVADAKGADFRTASSLPGWFYVIGARHAGIPAIWGRAPSGGDLVHRLVTEPGPVAALRALFGELWRRATPLRYPGPGHRDRRTVLCLLAQGLSDEAAARRLGVSVRTVRTRVAEAMAELGARTRFEAAVTAARDGWFD